MNCKQCDSEMEQVDTTYSNINTERSHKGQHTGDVYHCLECGRYFLDNFLTGNIESWIY